MDLERRVVSLEAQCRVLRNLLAVAGTAVVAVLLLGQTTGGIKETVTARNFVAMNEDGVGVVIRADENGGHLSVVNRDGGGVEIGVEQEGGEIIVRSRTGNPVVTIHSSPLIEAGWITTSSQDGQNLITLGSTAGSEKRGLLTVHGSAGTSGVLVGVWPDGTGHIVTQSATRDRLIEVGVSEEGHGSIVAFSSTNEVRARWP